MIHSFTACHAAMVRRDFPTTWQTVPSAQVTCGTCDVCKKLCLTCYSEPCKCAQTRQADKAARDESYDYRKREG